MNWGDLAAAIGAALGGIGTVLGYVASRNAREERRRDKTFSRRLDADEAAWRRLRDALDDTQAELGRVYQALEDRDKQLADRDDRIAELQRRVSELQEETAKARRESAHLARRMKDLRDELEAAVKLIPNRDRDPNLRTRSGDGE